MGSYSTPCEHAEQSRRYRELASAIRTRLPTLQDEEVLNELYLLATHYERLAEFADSLGSLEGVTWPDVHTHLARWRQRSREPHFGMISRIPAAEGRDLPSRGSIAT
jgi:hypothetical protein